MYRIKRTSKISTLTLLMLMITSLLSSNSIAEESKSLDKFGGWKGIQGKKTGFFHIEKINGRNWFITPEGNAFFAIGLSHMLSGESDLACKNIYGGDKDAWLEASFKKSQKMGFNCALGSATSPERNLNGFVNVQKAEKLFREHNFPFAVGVILLKHPWEFRDGETLPDIFHPDYEKLIESRAEKVCPRYENEPLCMGYYYGFGAFNQSDQWVNHHFSLPPGSPGREALVNLLDKRYLSDVEKFNKVYGTSLKSISDLKSKFELTYKKDFERRNYPGVKKRLDKDKLEDFEAIISHMCITLYKIGHDAIKRWDNNHLIMGSFIKEWALSLDSWKKASKYVDMIAPQHVNSEISVNNISDATNLPIIFSDEYFGFHYPSKPKRAHAGLISHDARGEVYKANLMRHFKDSQVMGVTYCACMYDQGGETLKKNNQNGFYSLEGKPRKKLIKAVTQLNESVYEHTTNPATESELQKLHEQLFEQWEKHSIKKKRKKR